MKLVSRIAFVALAVTLMACLGGDGRVHIVNFYSSPNSIYEGDATTLTWNSPGGSRVVSSNFDAQSATGSMTLYPTTTTTYEIKVRLASNDVVTEKTTVYVSSPPDDGGDEEYLSAKKVKVAKP